GISIHFASDNFDRFICLGAVIIFSIHFVLNTGSALGLTPVIGLPLPFVSYGGSNLLTSFIMVAIINSIALRS
ncbi:MAG: FtsW/RodA/SpoVE family cell cycle protein, partial [Candidatus Pacebacteria bacterium]|nr:FtsW/RodA/SpoVE family cell cycle protein [Candidatus Paceibacterota bacterium]